VHIPVQSQIFFTRSDIGSRPGSCEKQVIKSETYPIPPIPQSTATLVRVLPGPVVRRSRVWCSLWRISRRPVNFGFILGIRTAHCVSLVWNRLRDSACSWYFDCLLKDLCARKTNPGAVHPALPRLFLLSGGVQRDSRCPRRRFSQGPGAAWRALEHWTPFVANRMNARRMKQGDDRKSQMEATCG
jgi:hypothetical protein